MLPRPGWFPAGWLQIRQECSQQADRREKRADRIYEINAGDVGQLAQNGGAQPGHTKGEPKQRPEIILLFRAPTPERRRQSPKKPMPKSGQ